MIDAVVRQLSQLADANSLLLSRNDSSFVDRLCCVTDTDDTTRVTYRHAIVSSPPLSLSYDIIDRVSTSLLFKKKKGRKTVRNRGNVVT